MDAEEFMMHCFDSDVCDEGETENVSQTATEDKDCSQQHKVTK